MTLMAIIAYALILLFFAGVTCLLFLSMRPLQQETETQAAAPKAAETPGAYIFLAGLLLLLVFLIALTQKQYGQGH